MGIRRALDEDKTDREVNQAEFQLFELFEKVRRRRQESRGLRPSIDHTLKQRSQDAARERFSGTGDRATHAAFFNRSEKEAQPICEA